MKALLLVDHGSRRAASNEQLKAVAALVRERLGGQFEVAVAHMEIADPTIASAVEDLVGRGASQIVVVPYLLSPGRHSTEDIPRLARHAAARCPGVEVRIADCLGVDAGLADLVVRRAEAAGLRPLSEGEQG